MVAGEGAVFLSLLILFFAKIILITPPMASDPYNVLCAPFKISILLRLFIKNNFVSMIQGKPVTVGGRFALDNEKSTITKEDNLDIMKRLREEQAKSRNKQNKADIKMVEAFYAPIKIDEDKKGTLVDDWDLWDRPLPEANEEFSQVDALEKLNQDIETNIGTMWDDNYNATMMKTTEVIKHFVEQFNKVSNERKSAEIEAVKNDPKAKKVDEKVVDKKTKSK